MARQPTQATTTANPASEAAEPRWLDPEERAAWLGMVRVMTKLRSILDAQLQRDAGLTFFDYTVLAMLSEQPTRTLRMGHLAQVTDSSLSRLSHVAKRLEAQGLLRRELDPEDGRCTNAVLTDQGYQHMLRAAPSHVTAVRELIFDPMTRTQVRGLRAANDAILAMIDPDATTDPR